MAAAAYPRWHGGGLRRGASGWRRRGDQVAAGSSSRKGKGFLPFYGRGDPLARHARQGGGGRGSRGAVRVGGGVALGWAGRGWLLGRGRKQAAWGKVGRGVAWAARGREGREERRERARKGEEAQGRFSLFFSFSFLFLLTLLKLQKDLNST